MDDVDRRPATTVGPAATTAAADQGRDLDRGVWARGHGGGKDEEVAEAYRVEKRGEWWIGRGKACSAPAPAPAWSGQMDIGGVAAAEGTGGEDGN